MNVLLVLIVLFIMWHTWDRGQEEVRFMGYKTTHFYVSRGESKRMFERMRADGTLGAESLTLFLMLEDRLLSIEKTSVCSGTSGVREAFVVSDTIKERFQGYDFSYHATHLKQIAEPHKLINRNLRC